MANLTPREALHYTYIYEKGETAPEILELLGLKPSSIKLSKKQLEALKIYLLKESIELANKLPQNRHAADLDEFLREEVKSVAVPESYTVEYAVLKFKVLVTYLESFPPDFREYVLGDAVEAFKQVDLKRLRDDAVNGSHLVKLYIAIDRYDEFRRVRNNLRKIIEMGSGKRLFFLSRSIPAQATVRVGNDGRFELSVEQFARALVGLEANKIRACPVCGNIFWADRVDQKACTKLCANNYRVQRYRKQRAENRQYKQRKAKASDTKKGS